MKKRQIDNFFILLNKNLKDVKDIHLKVILTGAAAGILLGGDRPSLDIDFAIECKRRFLEYIEEAIKKISIISGIEVNFSEDIDRWSQITFLDYKRHTIPYKTFGTVEVTILSPEYWAIGKLARYLDPDVDDLIKVLRNNHTDPLKLAELLGRALLNSPRSSSTYLFKNNVEHFFRSYGTAIWGKGFDCDRCLLNFTKKKQRH